MKTIYGKALSMALACLMSPALRAAEKLDSSRIDEVTGLKGKWNEEEGVFKVSVPRNDIKVMVDKWPMPPFMGLTSWAAFTEGREKPAMVMGDLVLLQEEVNPVMSAALENGLQVTALHNHFFFDEPKVYFMHIGGEGSAEGLARGVRAAFDAVKASRARGATGNSFGGPPPAAQSSINAAALSEILGSKGETNAGMFKAVFGRKVKMPCGCEAGKEMGVNTWAAFAGTEDNAIVDGDFAVLVDELQPVLKSLRKSNINIVAIHHHMVGEEPRIIFLHYWGRGSSRQLAEAVRAAIGLTKR